MRSSSLGVLASVALLILLIISPLAAAETPRQDHIIYISSYGPAYIWNQEIEAGIDAAITGSKRTHIQLSIEYLDAKIIDDTTHFDNLYQTFAHKYRTANPDVIIVSDDPALLFINEYGERLFPGVPVVFTGINNPSNLPDTGNETPFYIGTLEILPVHETVNIIRKINPNTDTVYIILDTTYTGRAIRAMIDEQTAGRTNAIRYLYPKAGANISSISADLAELPETAAVLILTYYLADQELTPYHIDEISAELSAASPVPIYSAVSIYNNKGVVGGVQISPYVLGYNAGTHALWVLDEKPPRGTDPVIYMPETISLFDYTEMQRYGIPESALPKGTTIINRPSDSITVDRDVVIFTTIVVLILGILALSLIVQNLALTKTRALLAKSERLYRSVVEGQNEMITRFQTDGTIIFINQAYARYFGLDPDAMVGKKFRPYVHEDDWERVATHFTTLQGSNAHHTIEQRIVLNDGRVRWQRWDNQVIFDKDGLVSEYQSVGMDITERKEAEQKIHDSLQEKTLLLQEVHHRVKNNLAVISSMLEMQAIEKEEQDPHIAAEIREAEGRIRSMVAVHEELYRSDSFGVINVQSHVEHLARGIISTFPNAANITLNVNTQTCRLSLEKAIPISLILNELLTNAMKYAFAESTTGIITIRMECNNANTLFTVSDSGVGFPERYDPEQATTLGIRMVKTFVEYQLDGSYEITTGPTGTTWTIRFPSENE